MISAQASPPDAPCARLALPSRLAPPSPPPPPLLPCATCAPAPLAFRHHRCPHHAHCAQMWDDAAARLRRLPRHHCPAWLVVARAISCHSLPARCHICGYPTPLPAPPAPALMGLALGVDGVAETEDVPVTPAQKPTRYQLPDKPPAPPAPPVAVPFPPMPPDACSRLALSLVRVMVRFPPAPPCCAVRVVGCHALRSPCRPRRVSP